jgi:hypothetical protein
VTLLAMPPAWVDFSWELVRGERDNVKNRSLLLSRLDSTKSLSFSKIKELSLNLCHQIEAMLIVA